MSHRFAVPAQIEGSGPRSSRHVLITGAAAGLAKGIARAFAADGERVSFTYRPGGTPPDATLALLRPHDAGAVAIPADFTVDGAAAEAVRAAEAARGPVDVLVHAVGPIVVKRFARCTPDDYRAMIDANLGSAVALAFAVLPGMRERRYGRLAFFGMNGSSTTKPARGMALYGAAKAGVVTFARALALEEAANGISVNVIEPGDIRDKEADRAAARAVAANNPTGHAGSWEDVAAAVRFATADENGFLNGMVLGVNGGLAEPHE
ncbi:MAG: SDR family oxidoreductase [Candidatus Eremiobacteraeota bacterium]|nr:SDR family oxidoreductase [Candidatus Eremiobacteraeota bacterium]